MQDLPILFLDGEAILVDKPAGLPVDRPRNGAFSVEDALNSLRFGFERVPSPVHRLDRDTSGCLLLARNPKAHRRFAAAFEAGQVEKSYIAVLAGVPDGENGRIDLPLAKISAPETGWRIVPAARGKAAVTHWSLIGVLDGLALVRFRPATGRTHQLRVHALHGLGYAILGDPVYGAGSEGRSKCGPAALMLHAESLAMPRPNKPPVQAVAPYPARFDAWRALLAETTTLGLDHDG